MERINSEKILMSYLTVETMMANNPDYTFIRVLSAMKEAIRQSLEVVAEKYIVLNKTIINERINDLKESLKSSEVNEDYIRAGIESFEIKQLERILNESISLVSEVKNIKNERNNLKG